MIIDYAIGLLLFTSITFIIWLINDIVGHFNLQNLLKDWSAIATLITSGVALWIATNQQRHADKRENETRRRKERAARAVLPLALSELISYCIECVQIIYHYYILNDDLPNNIKLETPALPERLIETIQNVMEHSELELTEILATLINEVQIQNSRFNSSYVAATAKFRHSNLNYLLADAINLHAEASLIFKFARGVESKITNKKNIIDSTFILGIREENFPDVFNIMRKRKMIVDDRD